ncbi:cell wall hydrolase [Flavisphingomonas formosensis]|uniref:cell wall hydrolase n=1 Tax=Flavisphingomonas formosensis TaxID=861534 RepID=UPI001E3025EC|nr:cell wall hydrolase [Sphingomonas formosensis]
MGILKRRHGLGVAALLLTASCVAPDRAALTKGADPVLQAAPLLKKLELDVPKDVAAAVAAAEEPESKLAALTGAAPPFVNNAQTSDDADRALHCLAEAVYYEARSEPIEGQRAVAQVVLNRVRDRAFPHSVCGVVYQGSQRATGCQFSFTCDGSRTYAPIGIAWRRALAVAQAALDGSVYEPVGSATFYHTTAVSPWWAPSLTRIVTVGAHIFYRWSGRLERALAFRQDYSGSEPGKDPALASVGADASGATSMSIENGVRVFRDGADSARHISIADATDPAAVPAPDGPPAPKRTMVSASVRIHYGATADPAPEAGVATHIAADPS